MTRTRCGLVALSSFRLKLPLASVWVRPDSSIPWPRLRSTTSSPAAGLLVVPFLTVPVRVWAEAETETRRSVGSNTRKRPHFSQRTRKMGHPVWDAGPHVVRGDGFKLWLLFGCGVTKWLPLLPVAQSQPALRRLPLPEKSSWFGSQNPETCRL